MAFLRTSTGSAYRSVPAKGHPGWSNPRWFTGPGNWSWSASAWIKPTAAGTLLDCVSTSDFSYYNAAYSFTLSKLALAADRSLALTAGVSVLSGSADESHGTCPSPKLVTSAAGLISLDAWQHVAFSCDADAKQIKLYVNGSLIGTTTFPDQGLVGFGSDVSVKLIGTLGQPTVYTTIAEAPWRVLPTALGGFAEFAIYPKQVISAASVAALASGANPTRVAEFTSLYAPLFDGLSTTRADHPIVALPTASATVFSFRPPLTVRRDAASTIAVQSSATTTKLNAIGLEAQSSLVVLSSPVAARITASEAGSALTLVPYAHPGPAWPVTARSVLTASSFATAGFLRLASASSSVLVTSLGLGASGTAKAKSASSLVVVAPVITMAGVAQNFTRTASSLVNLSDGGDGALSNVFVDASNELLVTAESEVDDLVQTFMYVEARSRVQVRPRAPTIGLELAVEAWATSTVELSLEPLVDATRTFLRVAATTVEITSLAQDHSVGSVTASTTVALAGTAAAGRVISVAATTSMSLTGPSESNDLPLTESASQVTLGALATADLELLGGAATITLASRADVLVALPGGAVVPGGDSGHGLRTKLWDGVSAYPLSFAESPDGTVLMANGVGAMIGWDALASQAWAAGLAAPTTPATITAEALTPNGVYASDGPIMGKFAAFQRFLDARGNPSNLSPPGVLITVGRDGWIAGVTTTTAGLVAVTSPGHGLSPGDVVLISGVPEVPIDGDRTVGTVTADTFTLSDAVATSGTHHGGGTWAIGASSLTYHASPPTDPKVARRQILRNLDGDFGTFYVDVDTTDLTATTFTSSRTDLDLSTREPIPLADEDGFPLASNHGLPPSHKLAICAHQGRIFAAGEVAVTEGHAVVSLGSNVVNGIGTAWVPSLAGRLFTHTEAGQSFEIASVTSATSLTLNRPYDGPSSVFAPYAIRPAPAERRLVYYSEPNRPESWPSWNAFAVPESNDEIVGLVALKSSLFIVERRAIHRLTFKADPARDGMVFPKSGRGCVNHRCIAVADGVAYMLDESGIHAFDGDASEHLSDPVRAMFQSDPSSELRIDWSADRGLWHAVLDQVRGVIRWFVALEGGTPNADAIAFSYRSGRWWVERYTEPVTASCVGAVGHRRALAGTTARRVIVLGEGRLDALADGLGVTSGVVESAADGAHLVLSGGGLPPDLGGVPVCVVTGSAAGQSSVICDSTSSTLEVVEPFNPPPAPGDIIQVGGIPFQWRSGWFRYAPDESENPRDIELVFQPTTTAQTLSTLVYLDHSPTPMPWSRSREMDGTSITADSSRLVARLDSPRGHLIHRITGHSDPYASGDRYVSVELAGVQGQALVRVFQITLSGCGTQ